MSKDILIDANGDTQQQGGEIVTVAGAKATENRLRLIINWIAGESVIAPGEGIPYFESVRRRPADLSLLASELREAIINDPAVAAIENIDVTLDRERRVVTYRITGTADTGAEIRVTGDLD